MKIIGACICFFSILISCNESSKTNESNTSNESNLENNSSPENNSSDLSNRKFQNINAAGAKVTWEFNSDGSNVHITGEYNGQIGVNSTINIQSLGNGNYKGDNGYTFRLEGNKINSSGVILNEIN